MEDLEAFLGCNDVSNAVIVGAGKLGKALLDYEGFSEYGLHIVAGLDIRVASEETTAGGKPIFGLSKMEDLCKRIDVYKRQESFGPAEFHGRIFAAQDFLYSPAYFPPIHGKRAFRRNTGALLKNKIMRLMEVSADAMPGNLLAGLIHLLVYRRQIL